MLNWGGTVKKMKLPSKDCIDEIIEKQVAGKGYHHYFSSIHKWELSPSKREEIRREVDRLHSIQSVITDLYLQANRTEEEAELAFSDCLEGNFRRIQELGVSPRTLVANGWDGNIYNLPLLCSALEKQLKEISDKVFFH